MKFVDANLESKDTMLARLRAGDIFYYAEVKIWFNKTRRSFRFGDSKKSAVLNAFVKNEFRAFKIKV